MSRIKVRVYSGVFEVRLIRAIEECGSIEVLWDGSQPRELKWSSVVLKMKEGEVVGQKPDVMAEPPPPMSGAAEAQRVNKAKKKKARGGEGVSGTGASGKRKFFFILRMKVM